MAWLSKENSKAGPKPQITEKTWDQTVARWEAIRDGKPCDSCPFCALSPGNCTPAGQACPLDGEKGCCNGLWDQWRISPTRANAQAVLDYIRARRAEWEAQQEKEIEMKIKIELVDQEPQEPGVPWRQAPLGPARVVSPVGAYQLNTGDIVLVVQYTDKMAILRSGLLRMRDTLHVVTPDPAARIEPLGRCTLYVTFA